MEKKVIPPTPAEPVKSKKLKNLSREKLLKLNEHLCCHAPDSKRADQVRKMLEAK